MAKEPMAMAAGCGSLHASDSYGSFLNFWADDLTELRGYNQYQRLFDETMSLAEEMSGSPFNMACDQNGIMHLLTARDLHKLECKLSPH